MLIRASARQLQDFGFDFAVPDTQTPTQPGSSGRKKGASQLGSLIRSATRASTRSTPPASQASGGQGSTVRRSRRSKSASVDFAEVTRQDEEGSATKRRRVSPTYPVAEGAEDVSVNAEPLPDIVEEVSGEESEPEVQPSRTTPDLQVPSEHAQSQTFLETPQSPASRRKIVQYSGSGKKPTTSASRLVTPGQRQSFGQLRLKDKPASPYRRKKKRRSIAQKIKGHGPRKSPLASRVDQAPEPSPNEDEDHASASPAAEIEQPGQERVDLEPTTQPMKEAKRPVKQRLLNALRKITSRPSSKTPQSEKPGPEVVKKRGRPRKSSPVRLEANADDRNEVQNKDTATPISTSKKRGRPRKSSPIGRQTARERDRAPGNDWGDVPASVPKKRGRPRRSSTVVQTLDQEGDPELDEEPEQHPPRTTREARSNQKPTTAVETDEGAPINQEGEAEGRGVVVPKKRGRPRKSDVDATTPAAPRPQIPSSSAQEPSSSTGAAQSASNEGARTISVGVYRMTGAKNLDLGIDEDARKAAGYLPMPKKSGVNAIDVLHQICGEMVHKNLDRIRKGGQKEKDAAKKKEWQAARRMVAQFGEDLDTRLLQMVSEQSSPFMSSPCLLSS